MKIGETILKLREEKKMSQEEFAKYFHVTRQTISNWEKEKSFPDLETLVKISDASGISIDSMLRDDFKVVHQIDKKVRHLKFFKIGTAIILAIVLVGGSYIGIQNVRQKNIMQTYESRLDELGFEKNGDDYCLEDADFVYNVYLFDRPAIWKWNQEPTPSEKFVVGRYKKDISDLSEPVDIMIRKTKEFTTLEIIKGTYMGKTPQVQSYNLDENGQITHEINKENYKIYTELQSEIKEAVEKMEEIYSKLYA